MSIDNLPPEVLGMIIEEVFWAANSKWKGVIKASQLRGINRVFDGVIRNKIFGMTLFGPVKTLLIWMTRMYYIQKLDSYEMFLYQRVKVTHGSSSRDSEVAAILKITDFLMQIENQSKEDQQKIERDDFHKREKIWKALSRISRENMNKRSKDACELCDGAPIRRKALIAALCCGFCYSLRLLLQQGADMELCSSLLFYLQGFDQEHTTGIFLDYVTGNFSAQLEDHRSYCNKLLKETFREACLKGHIHTLKAFLQREKLAGASIGDCRSLSVFSAADSRQEGVARIILNYTKREDVTILYGDLLDAAIARGREELAALILDRGDWRPYGHNGRPNKLYVSQAACSAAGLGSIRLLRALSTCGADFNYSAKYDSPLMCATNQGHAEVVRWLFQKGAKRDSLGGSSIHELVNKLVCCKENSPTLDRVIETIEALVEHRAIDVNLFCGSKHLLTRAALSGEIRLVNLLLELGANPKRQRNGLTPLLAAIVAQKPEDLAAKLVKRFLDLGLSPNSVGTVFPSQSRGIRGEEHPLALAISWSKFDIARLLVRYGAILDEKKMLAIPKEVVDKVWSKPLRVNPPRSCRVYSSSKRH